MSHGIQSYYRTISLKCTVSLYGKPLARILLRIAYNKDGASSSLQLQTFPNSFDTHTALSFTLQRPMCDLRMHRMLVYRPCVAVQMSQPHAVSHSTTNDAKPSIRPCSFSSRIDSNSNAFLAFAGLFSNAQERRENYSFETQPLMSCAQDFASLTRLAMN
ncbi:hypothetical protein NX059_006487 [Plenodomus lindquistii]|nr:hypothetical protein NX059_006487 [Plenodomus lindquistii]